MVFAILSIMWAFGTYAAWTIVRDDQDDASQVATSVLVSMLWFVAVPVALVCAGAVIVSRIKDEKSRGRRRGTDPPSPTET